ncbi:GntR family transcriptional regulator [Modicisalibacter radicis]|uniref:GntR family transcriptional regulator n=1 Tax=Halomonas sp. EAR18 TaxID=2518972 RepID=UPI00109C0525|nr:GntR family transcriptional regulator [Halomonas sp. EAR18]
MTEPTDQAAPRGAAPRLHQRVHAILAEEIHTGQLADRERLAETALAARFGISRAPVRQALTALAAEGLVERRPGGGFRVRAAHHAAARPGTARQPQALASQPSWEKIYAEVVDEIVPRTAFGDWRVIESELARYHAVSRTVAREVMARLQQRGIVRKAGHSRWHAPALTPAHVNDVYEMREVLEPAALMRAVPHVAPERIAAMAERLRTAMARATTLAGHELDRLEGDLHGEVLGACPNREMRQAIRFYHSLLVAHSFLYRWTPPLYATEPFLPEHLRIFEALETGHTARAAKALEEHLRASRERAIARVEAVASAPRPAALPYLQEITDA